jgi:hypothetical protein
MVLTLLLTACILVCISTFCFALESTLRSSSRSLASKSFTDDVPVFSRDVLLDTWEPGIVALSNNDIIVFALNQYGVRACVDCGSDPIIYRKSSNNGETWDEVGEYGKTWAYISEYELTWFADIVAVVDPSDNIYITYIGYTNQPPPHPWNILFQKSTDKGMTFSEPVIVSGNISADKNWISIDHINPENLYVTFNGQFPFAVASSDGGDTWSDPVLMEELDGSYFFAGGSDVRPDGAVFFAYMATPNYADGGEEEESYYSYDQGFDESNSTANFTYAKVYASADKGTKEHH